MHRDLFKSAHSLSVQRVWNTSGSVWLS